MKFKKAISALLVCVMVFAMLPLGVISASAAGDTLSLSVAGNGTAASGSTYSLAITLNGVTEAATVGTVVTVNISCSDKFTINGSSTLTLTANAVGTPTTTTATFKVNSNVTGEGTISAQITSATSGGNGVAYNNGASQTQHVIITDGEKPQPIVSFTRNTSSSTTGTLTASANETAALYYYVSTSTSYPNKNDMQLAGTIGVTPITSNIAVSPNECYIYYYAKDSSNNESDISFIHVATYASANDVPAVSLQFTRTDATTGTLYVTSDKAGKFYYTVSASSNTPAILVTLTAGGTKTIPLTSLPSTATKVWYCTTDNTGTFTSPTNNYSIPAYSSGDTTAPTVAVSVSRSNSYSTTLNFTVYASEACTFYYMNSSNTYTQKTLYAGTNTFQVTGIPITTTYIMYYATDYSNNSSQPNYSQINSSSTNNGPVLSSLSLANYSTYYTVFAFTSDRAGKIYFYPSNTNVTGTANFYQQTMTAGQNQVQLPVTYFSDPNVRLYYYAEDSYGNQTGISSISLNSLSSASYPTLTNVSLYSTTSGYGTFSYTADKTGMIYYVVSTSPVYSIDLTSSTASNYITSTTGSFYINNLTLNQPNARVYYVTADIYGNKSAVQSIALNSSSTTTNYPTLSNVYFSVPTSSPYSGTLTFTSNMAGYLCYGLSTDANIAKTSLTNSTPITQGSNTFTISTTYSATASLLNMKLYYYTVSTNPTFVESTLNYVLPNSASSTTDSTISTVAFTNITAPVAGKTPSYSYSVANSDSRFTVSDISWYQTDSLISTSQSIKLSSSDKFQSGQRYCVILTLNAKTGYTFPISYLSFSSTVNGKTATLLNNYSTSTVTIAYLFDSTGTTTGTVISSVAVSGIDEPQSGNTPDTTGITGGQEYKINDITWSNNNSKFVGGTSYTVTVTLTPAAGYTFKSGNIGAKINSLDADIVYKSTEGTLLVISHTYKVAGDSTDNWTNPFSDVSDNDRYYVYIKYCSINNIMKGISDKTFSPKTTLNRAMFVTILGRLAGVDVSSYTTKKFNDVLFTKDTQWYAPYVTWAAQNGIVLGYDNGKFGPNDPVTREQMCVFLLRYAKYAGIKLGYNKKDIEFSDAAKISTWATEAVSIFEQAGVAVSKPNSNGYDPTTNALRQEIAEILILFMMKYMNG